MNKGFVSFPENICDDAIYDFLRDNFAGYWQRLEINWKNLGGLNLNFTRVDKAVRRLMQIGSPIIGLLDYSINVGNQFTCPADLNQWLDYVYAVVTRYPQIRYWEVWNEPDSRSFWDKPLADFWPLQRLTYRMIKTINPALTVLNGGFSGIDVADDMPKGICDALAVHNYQWRQSKDDKINKDIINRMKKVADGRKIFLTEFNVRTHAGKDLKAALGSLRKYKTLQAVFLFAIPSDAPDGFGFMGSPELIAAYKGA